MARIEVTAANFRGRDLEGSGTDTLVLIGGGTFDFNYVNFSGFSEIISESGTAYFTSIVISSEHLEDITSISSASAFYNSSIYVSGNNIDLSNKTFNNIADIYIESENAVVTVSDLSVALKVDASEHQGETIVLNGPVTTPTSRADLHNRGFDKIIQGSNVWNDASPILTGLNGHFYVREGGSVSLDPEHDAAISDDGGPIAYLDITLSGSGHYFAMDDFEIGSNFTITDNEDDQNLLYKGSIIGIIDRLYDQDGSTITFNQSATVDIINEFVQSLAYSPGNFVYYQNVTVTITARDKGNRKAEAVLQVTAEKNWTPTKPTLNGALVSENAATGTVVGTLKATDANGDPVSYRLTDDAGGRFSIVGDKLVVSGRVPLDFEQASKHNVTVIANDGEKNGLPATFTISLVDTVEKFLGTKGKDKLSGTAGQDLLNGGLGSDTLTGGGNADVFVFDTKLGKTNIDKITDFATSQDKIHLDDSVFKKLGKAGPLKKGAFYVGAQSHDKDDRIIYNKKTGALYYDQDGTGAAKAVQFSTLTKKLGLKYTDFFVI